MRCFQDLKMWSQDRNYDSNFWSASAISGQRDHLKHHRLHPNHRKEMMMRNMCCSWIRNTKQPNCNRKNRSNSPHHLHSPPLLHRSLTWIYTSLTCDYDDDYDDDACDDHDVENDVSFSLCYYSFFSDDVSVVDYLTIPSLSSSHRMKLF